MRSFNLGAHGQLFMRSERMQLLKVIGKISGWGMTSIVFLRQVLASFLKTLLP